MLHFSLYGGTHEQIQRNRPIYDHRFPQLRSPEVWEQTLRMTSSFWRLNFCEAMLLTLQNPKAEMCGTIDQWNNIGRYIRRGEHSTAVFRSRTDTQLMYLFDMRQTYGKAYNSKWKLSERVADGIVGKFNSENAENAVSFGEHQRTVPPDMEGNREESRENSEQHNTLSADENFHQPGLLREREPADGDRHGGAGSRVGIPADERILAGGGSTEPGESDGDSENLDEPDDEELDEMVSDDESDTISVFTDIPEEISPDSDYAKKLLEDEIIRGSGFSNGKFRISEYVSENSPGKDELAKFLKNEYGIGGSSRNDDPVSFSNHDGKGIELVLSNKQVIRFNWKKVAEAVRSAVNSGKYITESDIETRRRMTLFDAQRFAIHYEYPHCLYNDRLDYIRKEIAACGLDYPIRLNADMFAVYAAECVRTKPHVKESYQKIDRSSIDIPWKFNDWSEAAEAGKNLPVDSGYGQFRAMCRDSVSELIN